MATKMKKQKIKCAKLEYKGEHPTAFDYETEEEFERVNISANGPKWARDLLPQNIGPLIIEELYDPLIVGLMTHEQAYAFTKIKPKEGWVYSKCENIQALWDGSKVLKEEVKDGKILKSFFETRHRIWSDTEKKKSYKSGKVVGYYFKTKIIDVIEARKVIFCGAYAMKVVKEPAYRKLLKMTEDTPGLLIYGYDGFDLDRHKMSIKSCLEYTDVVFGHELTLVGLLRGDTPWEL
jgi:hypothetical protein